MACEYCMGEGYHRFGCPNYAQKGTRFFCPICGDSICIDDEYIEYEGEYLHMDCLRGMTAKKLVETLGYDVKVMEEDY